MGRLTKRYPKGVYKNMEGTPVSYKEICEKLANYEDLEEQGLLIKLPCKVGDSLYQPYVYGKNAKGINEIVVGNMVVEIDIEEGKRAYIVGHYVNTNCGVAVDFSEIGESAFVHKAEAEKTLAEMRCK